MQDSEEDWKEQASSMGEIYAHGYCNIAATGFENGSTGLFVERDISPLALEAECVDINKAKTTLRAGVYHLLEANCWDIEVESAPLNSRGWVVQERLLSQRTIHFGSKQIFWECGEMRASELYPLGIPGPAHVSNKKYNGSQIIGEGDERRSASWLDIWSSTIELYSKNDLTYCDKDKLVAISGLARRTQSETNARYLAGMWREHLELQLTWSAISTLKRPRYRCPSWSWASVDGAITDLFPVINKFGTYAKVKDAWTKPERRFGSCIDGTLFLTARLGLMRLFFTKKSFQIACENAERFQMHPPHPSLFGIIVQIDAVDAEFGMDDKVDWQDDFQGADLIQEWNENLSFSVGDQGVVLFSPILLYERDGTTAVNGILLMPTGRAKGYYKRIGMFTAGILSQKVILEVTKSLSWLPSEMFIEQQEGEYTIGVI